MAGANCCSLRHDDHAERTWGEGKAHLTSSHAWKTESRATWSEKRLPAKFLWTWPSRFPSLTNGSGKQEAAEMVHMASPTLGGDSSTGQGVRRLRSLWLPSRTDWKMQPRIIILPRRGSMGNRARMRPSGVSSSLTSRASSSAAGWWEG